MKLVVIILYWQGETKRVCVRCEEEREYVQEVDVFFGILGQGETKESVCVRCKKECVCARGRWNLKR